MAGLQTHTSVLFPNSIFFEKSTLLIGLFGIGNGTTPKKFPFIWSIFTHCSNCGDFVAITFKIVIESVFLF